MLLYGQYVDHAYVEEGVKAMLQRSRVFLVAAGLMFVLLPSIAAGRVWAGHSAAGKPVTIGVIQITLTHGYQKILNDGYRGMAQKLGAKMKLCINNLQPGPTVTCAEDLINGGAQALIVAPADKSSFASVVNLAKAKGIPVVNDGSPQPIQADVVPFTGTDSIGGGRIAGQFTVNWIKQHLGGKAQVAELTLPTFTDCVNRNKGFHIAMAKLTGAPTVASQNGNGLRAKALPAMESMLEGHPNINVVFGCNDDSALGALSALQGKHKDPQKTLVVGFDGTIEAFNEIKKGGMFRADIVQRPDCYSRRMMQIAVSLARHQVTTQTYIKKGYYFVHTAIVTPGNVSKWLKWGQTGNPADAPEQCRFATNHQ
jgi:ribose transport system substrate-binding protein